MLKLNIALVILSYSVAQAIHWTYKDHESWPGICQTGKAQSPINLETKEAQVIPFPKIVFKHYNVGYPAIVKNSGHSIIVKIATPYPSITGGGLPFNEYILDHLHFHWESEHTINGFRYPLELHVVHYAAEFENLTAALNRKGGIAVLGVLYDYSPEDDDDFKHLTDVLKNVEKAPNMGVSHMEGVLVNKFIPRDTAGFFRYQGSLTTPNCNEVVVWTVFTNAISISKTQVAHFLSVQSEDGLLGATYRPLQELEGRTIYKKVSPLPHGADAAVALKTNIIVIISLWVVALAL